MTTRITIWGTAGRIYADRQECQVYLRDTAPIPDGYEQGWNVRYTTELTEPVWFYLRGEEYSAQVDHFVDRVKAGELDGLNGFAERGRDRPHHRDDARRRAQGRVDARRRRGHRAATASRRRRSLPWIQASAGACREQAETRGRPMDRLLFGDNQFFGVNHMSEEKARAQAMRFQDTGRRDRRARRRLRRGHPHLHVHDARPHLARSATTSARNPEPLLTDFTFYPVHALRAQVRQRGHRERHARRRQALPPRRGLLDAAIRGGASLATEGHRRDHHAADRRRDEDVRRAADAGDLPAEHRRRPAARARLQATRSGSSPTTCATATTPSRASSR